MDSNTTVASVAASEHPATKTYRLARELSAALADFEGGEVALVWPQGRVDYPISFCLYERFAMKLQRLNAYERAHREKVRIYAETFGPNESVPLPERPEHKRYWDAFHRCNLAHYALMDAFEDEFVIEGRGA